MSWNLVRVLFSTHIANTRIWIKLASYLSSMCDCKSYSANEWQHTVSFKSITNERQNAKNVCSLIKWCKQIVCTSDWCFKRLNYYANTDQKRPPAECVIGFTWNFDFLQFLINYQYNVHWCDSWYWLGIIMKYKHCLISWIVFRFIFILYI